MIAAKYSKTLIQRQFITDLATETAVDIYQVQTSIAKAHSRSGTFYRFLAQRPFSITNLGMGVRLIMRYLVPIRYMDMKIDYRTNTKKKNYQPIYNKIVWGFIYGYLYKQLRWGISRQLNEAIIEKLTSVGFKLQ